MRLGLDRMERLCAALGSPERSFKAIHVAGTNGKGSICAMLHAVLNEAGHEAALYTSPHLVTALERVRLGTRDWTEAELVGAINESLEAIHRNPELSADPPTTFELITAAAFLAIARAGFRLAVIEVGLGGRLDSTNVCDPSVSIISSIGLDHQAILGPDILDIAREKAGIIRQGVPVVTSAFQPAVQRLIQDKATQMNAPCYLGGRHFDFARVAADRFDFLGIQTRWADLPLPLPGDHQFQNAATACAALETLQNRGLAVTTPQVRTGLAAIRWPGRLEQVSKRPDLWLDGAHNPDAARMLLRFLEPLAREKKVHLVVALKGDKQRQEFFQPLVTVAHRITVTTAPGLVPAGELGELVRQMHHNVVIEPDLGKILAQICWRRPSDEAAFVTGSLYLVGAAKRWLAAQGAGLGAGAAGDSGEAG